MLIQTGRTVIQYTELEHPTMVAIDRGRPPPPQVHRTPQDGLRTSRPAKVLSGTGREGEVEGPPAARRGRVRRVVSP
jgi:hypothetical protein